MFVKALITASLVGTLVLVSAPSQAQTTTGPMAGAGGYQTGSTLPVGAGLEFQRECDRRKNSLSFATCNLVNPFKNCFDASVAIGPWILRMCRDA